MASSMEDNAVDAMAFIVSITVVFVIGIIVHIFVIVGNIVAWMKGKPLASTDQIITSLEISRVIYMLTCMFDGASKFLLKKAVVITILFNFVRTTSNYSCVWFLALLSVVFCLKISNFHNVFFQCLRSIISTRVIHLIVGSVLISASQASLNVWIADLEFSNNYTSDFALDITRPKVQVFLLWNTMPFLIYLLAAVPLIAYLSCHARRMKREAKITHLDSYYKAIWFTTISFFSCAIHISINVNPAYYSYSFIYVLLNFLLILHSIFLIFAMNKLKNQLSWILQQVTKFRAVNRASGISF
ncbi:taste receptor type 2 member 64-like [Lithobates pipiens]